MAAARCKSDYNKLHVKKFAAREITLKIIRLCMACKIMSFLIVTDIIK